jgi:hypothetical protein
MIWTCDIPGASTAASAWHLALEVGLAVFVVIGGCLFLAMAWRAYRRPAASAQATSSASIAESTGSDRYAGA